MFSQFGKISYIQAVKTNKLRGQAWIVFADLNSATNALRAMQGFPFFEKNLVRSPFRSTVLPCSRKPCFRS